MSYTTSHDQATPTLIKNAPGSLDAPRTARVIATVGRRELDHERAALVWVDVFYVDLLVTRDSEIDDQVENAIADYFPGFELATWDFPRESAEDEF